MKYIDYNDLSDLGLIYKINQEVLHPLGLALSRNTSGTSDKILVDDKDFKFEYSEDVATRNEEKFKEFMSDRVNILTQKMKSDNE